MTKPFSKEVTDVLATAYALISNDVDHGAVGLIKALLATIAELQAPQKEDVYDKARRLGLTILDRNDFNPPGLQYSADSTLPRCAAPEAVEQAASAVRDALPHTTMDYGVLMSHALTMARYIETGAMKPAWSLASAAPFEILEAAHRHPPKLGELVCKIFQANDASLWACRFDNPTHTFNLCHKLPDAPWMKTRKPRPSTPAPAVPPTAPQPPAEGQ